MKYVIRLDGQGYYGSRPYVAVPIKDANVFISMREARQQLNRLNGLLMKGGGATIEPYNDQAHSCRVSEAKEA